MRRLREPIGRDALPQQSGALAMTPAFKQKCKHTFQHLLPEQKPMPLYAYRCSDCDREFETLVRSGETPQCPSCGGSGLERLLSLIAKPASGGESSPQPCAAMSGGTPCGACPAFGANS